MEGQTELLFVEWLIKNIAGAKKILITKKEATGGKRNSRQLSQITGKSENLIDQCEDTEYYILIVNCGNDGKVKSDILDHHVKLSESGYGKIIGIRDVYPDAKYVEIPQLRAGYNKGLPAGTPVISFIFAVMELEAWLIAEYTHFCKIHPNITPERIKHECGIDVFKDDITQREKPSADLTNIYWLEMIPYDKSNKQVTTLLSAMDFYHLKNTICLKFGDLNNLFSELDHFFSS